MEWVCGISLIIVAYLFALALGKAAARGNRND